MLGGLAFLFPASYMPKHKGCGTCQAFGFFSEAHLTVAVFRICKTGTLCVYFSSLPRVVDFGFISSLTLESIPLLENMRSFFSL